MSANSFSPCRSTTLLTELNSTAPTTGPKALNALSLELWRQIERSALDLRQNQDVRAVVLAGEGRAFCSGLDVKGTFAGKKGPSKTVETLLHREEERVGIAPFPRSRQERELALTLNLTELNFYATPQVDALAQAVGYLWRTLDVPVIASLHGVCFGGGLQIALGADKRFASPTCRLSVMEAKWGL